MNNRALMAVAMTLMLGACERSPPEDAATGSTRSQASAANASRNDAVTAVLQSTGEPVARLSFLLETRPEVGKPFELALRVLAAAAVPELAVSAEAAALTVTPATASLALEAGTPATHTLSLTARQAGLTEVIVTLKAGDGPPAVYSIPLLIAAAGA